MHITNKIISVDKHNLQTNYTIGKALNAYKTIKSSHVLAVLICLSWLFGESNQLDNGLNLKPPMGWLSWQRFRCNIDCTNDSDNCISEKLYTDMADRMVADGYLQAGYDYVNIDDCWTAKTRDRNGRLQADPDRFPHGIKWLADYMHQRGLKLGIYGDWGNFTCAGYPGSINHVQLDTQTFADWEVDMLKLDGCYADPRDMDRGYPDVTFYLNRTGRNISFSCSWPAYQVFTGMKPNYSAIAANCNLWRNYNDIQDSWDSILGILDYYGDHQEELVPFHGPGHWNDPDMLIIGNFGLSYEQSRSQMALWAILAAPLLMSNDLRNIREEHRKILLNKNIIAVNQDVLGIQGRRVYKNNGVEIWLKPVLPLAGRSFSYSVAFMSRRVDGTPVAVRVVLQDLGLNHTHGYHISDLFESKNYGRLLPNNSIRVNVNPTGVVLIRADAVQVTKFNSDSVNRESANHFIKTNQFLQKDNQKPFRQPFKDMSLNSVRSNPFLPRHMTALPLVSARDRPVPFQFQMGFLPNQQHPLELDFE